jgi:hypothetical protein
MEHSLELGERGNVYNVERSDGWQLGGNDSHVIVNIKNIENLLDVSRID